MERRAKSITSILLIEFLLLHNTLSQHGFEESAAARTLKQESHHTHEVHCSRERSRVAWQIIEEYLMSFVEEEGYQISTKCRLHPDNDIFRDQEEHKIYLDVNEWRCGYLFASFIYILSSGQSLADSCFPITQGSSASRLHEANKFTLHGYVNTDFDVASYFLSSLLFVSKRYEEGNPSAKASFFTSWTENKTLVVGRLMTNNEDFFFEVCPYFLIASSQKFQKNAFTFLHVSGNFRTHGIMPMPS
ncbi:hypothetical protein CRYUN_Cryun19dG0018800 [Craigia yunnanensis]